MRVAVYAIARNEARHVTRFLNSCTGADGVIVADTGSTDDTVTLLRLGGATVHRIAIQPWRFDDARNAALALVPAEVDVCIALDLDEVLSDGWRDALTRAWTDATTIGRYRYVTAHLPNGAPAVEVSGMKIHRRFGYRWQHMIHEILVEDRLEHPRETWLAGLQVDHWPDRSKSRSGYLGLLEAAVAAAPDNPRDLFLLGREYAFLKRWDDADSLLRRYLAAAGDRWPRQRAAAWRRLAQAAVAKGDFDRAIADLGTGLRLAPDQRDLWFDLADVYGEMEDWRASFDAAKRGLALPVTPGPIANDYLHAGGRPYHRASLAAWHLGQLADAHALALEATTREPGNALFARHLRDLGTGGP